MPPLSFPPKVLSADKTYQSATTHKTNSMAGTLSGIQNTIDTLPANSRNMRALPADSTLNSSIKLTNDAKKAISQQINELTKTGNPSYEIKTALFQQYAIPLMKAQLNDKAIDDQTLIKHLTNTTALEGKIQRFSDQIDSFKQQKLGSAKATHLEEAFRALEESIETLLLPDSPLDKSEPELTTSSGSKQPATSFDDIDGRTPAKEAAKPDMPTGSGNVYHNCHFGNNINGISTDKTPFNFNITLNVNGTEVTASSVSTSSEGVPQQASTSSAETENTINHEQAEQPIAEKLLVKNETQMAPAAASSKQEISTQTDDDTVDGAPYESSSLSRETKSEILTHTQPTTMVEQEQVLREPKQSSVTLSRSQSETALNIDDDRSATEDQPFAPLFRSQSEPILNTVDTGGYKKGADGKWTKEEQPSTPLSRSQSETVLDTGGYKKAADGKWTKEEQPSVPLPRSQSEIVLDTGGYKKGEDGKWTKEKLHSKTDVVLSQGATQSSNIAGKKAYSLNDVRGNGIDRANSEKVTSNKATQTDAVNLESQGNLAQTLNVTINMDIDESHTDAEIQRVDVSTTPAKPSFTLSERRASRQKPLKRSLSADDVRMMNNVHINSRTGKPFTHPVYSDQRVTLTGGGQVRSLSQENLYFNSDKRFKTEVSS